MGDPGLKTSVPPVCIVAMRMVRLVNTVSMVGMSSVGSSTHLIWHWVEFDALGSHSDLNRHLP